MARHSIFPARLGKVHITNATPAAALSAYILLMFAVPVIWSTQADVVTVFGYAGTLAAFGFLLAYFMVSVAAPAHLRKLGELKPGNVAVAVLAFVFLLVPPSAASIRCPPTRWTSFRTSSWPTWRWEAPGCSSPHAGDAAS
jgi:amino acid transporter